MDFYEQVRAAGTPRETKADVIEYFQETYKGVKTKSNGDKVYEWKTELVNALTGVATNKNGELMSRANIARRFQSGREVKPEKQQKTKEEYQHIGETIPTKPPENGYLVEGVVYIKFSDGECEPRDVEEYITGADADALAKAAGDDLLSMLVNRYMELEDGEEPGYSIGQCDDPELTVTPIEE